MTGWTVSQEEPAGRQALFNKRKRKASKQADKRGMRVLASLYY